ncbi:oxidoreductase [Kitasatospora sp. MMS16-BH015]|uniref:FAD-binding oxidoreductase n=1 Tax=Kitasatospora sp. MMS16-BH015 TaxID=2018025 RepID=UPI000CA2EEE1|nr:FAD-binding oxidoreductase [Kitasatospora sp. MMS16-BH015]AUG75052.1 oxidoreductase [Kitasatospora sp. MMS16-BH015]
MGMATIEELAGRVHGSVVVPGSDGYEEARRVYNGMVDRRPAAVVRCVNAGDVLATVAYAREHGLDLAVRGGAHSVPGYGTCEGGLVADLGGMRGVRVDPATRTARVEGGATLADLDAATHAFGLGVTGGVVSTTGVGGLTLGGGFGHLARGLGLTCDNLLSADVVTADGRLLVASEHEYPDLFWALRGGTGNFGAVTSFEFRLSPVDTVHVGLFFHEAEQTEAVLKHFREYIATAPEQLGAFAGFQIAPPLPFIPEERHGDTFVIVVACWNGPEAEAEQAFQPFRDAAPVSFELSTPMPYPALQSLFDGLLPPGLQHYWKAAFSPGLTDAAVTAHAAHGPKVPVINSTCHIYPINGACHRVAPEATAFSYRDAGFATVIAGMWPDPADNEANTAWVRDYYAAIAPHSSPGGYVNFMAEDDQGRVSDNYRDNYARLVQVKRAYDPGNLFHVNHNIRP